jgi:RNA polymerase sigma-70 factor (ECF subfamily)
MKNPQEPSRNSRPISGPNPEAGFAAHYQRMFGQLVTIAAGVLGQREGAEDVVQQAVGIAIEKGRQFDSPPQLFAWLASAVRNCALNDRRRRIGHHTHAVEPAELGRSVIGRPLRTKSPIDRKTGELHADQAEFDDEVLAALETLTPEARCCLLLREVQNLAYDEIATLMDMPAGTAMSHVCRSKQRLRELLAPQEAPSSS